MEIGCNHLLMACLCMYLWMLYGCSFSWRDEWWIVVCSWLRHFTRWMGAVGDCISIEVYYTRFMVFNTAIGGMRLTDGLQKANWIKVSNMGDRKRMGGKKNGMNAIILINFKVNDPLKYCVVVVTTSMVATQRNGDNTRCHLKKNYFKTVLFTSLVCTTTTLFLMFNLNYDQVMALSIYIQTQ